MLFRRLRQFSTKILLLAASQLIQGQVFASDLQHFYELSLLNDPAIRAAEASYNASKANVGISRSALLPQINLQGQYSEFDSDSVNNDSIAQFAGGSITDTASDSTTYFATLNQPIFNLPRYHDYRQSKENRYSAAAQFGLEKQNLAIRVAEAYFNTLRAIDNLDSVMSEEGAFKTQKEQTKKRFDVGLIPITDVHETQAAYDEVVVRLLEARGQLGIRFDAMSELTGQFHAEITPLSSEFPIIDPSPLSVDEWLASTLEFNATVEASEYQKNAAEQNYKARRSAHLPTVDVSANIGNINTDGTRNQELFDNQNNSNSIMLSLRVPLFTGGLVSNQRKLAYQQLLQAKESYLASKRRAVQMTRSLHLSVVTKVAQITALQKSVNSSQSALNATQAGHKAGTRDLVDLLIAERTFYQARRNLLNARYDYIANLLSLKRSAGVLNSNDMEQLNVWLDSDSVISRGRYF
ncbi:MAG: outer membrane protein [Arenicella sp.]|jgi:outer membrane protein